MTTFTYQLPAGKTISFVIRERKKLKDFIQFLLKQLGMALN
jgi:hypothetical protein